MPEQTVTLEDLTEAMRTAVRDAVNAGQGPGDGASPAETTQDAAMASAAGGIIGTLDGFRIPVLDISLPFGTAIVGGGAGLVAYGLAAKVFPQKPGGLAENAPNILANLGGAYALHKWGPGIMGESASKFALGTLALTLALQYTPMKVWTFNLIDALSKPLVGLKLPGMGQFGAETPGNITEFPSAAYGQGGASAAFR